MTKDEYGDTDCVDDDYCRDYCYCIGCKNLVDPTDGDCTGCTDCANCTGCIKCTPKSEAKND